MNVFGIEMGNVSLIFEDYVKELKLGALDKYVYVIRDNVFGDIIFSASSNGIRMISCSNLHDKYFGKMYLIDAIKNKTFGYESPIGVIEGFDSISLFNAQQQFERAMTILRFFSNDVNTSDNIEYINSLNTNDTFYNDILIKKSADGAGKFNIFGKIIYIAPSMLPSTKSTDLDAEGYYKTGNDYFTVKFISHKNKYDVCTFMRFLYL